MTDIEIAQNKKPLPISEIAKKLNMDPNTIEYYGLNKAKIPLDLHPKTKENGKLILVTSTNPTPFGEGKTTMTIGIHDALCKMKEKSLAILREPSLGPVFGIKGGATGGGYAQVIPMEDINLHFTGDIHAITSANNLLSAIIDNHLFQGNDLNIDPKTIIPTRCLDINDRALRNIKIGENNQGIEREEQFVISVASELMAILCLAQNLEDLKNKISQILIGYTINQRPIYVSDLKCQDAMTILLKDAIKPNLVQTLEENPVLIHGGPFANIAHGCNSIIATKLGLKLADYVITEAGFGADLGAEKFLDIKCPKANIKPNVIVINTTIRSIKYNGGIEKENLTEENIEAIKKGIINLKTHIENMSKYTKNLIICINHFHTDTKNEIDFVQKYIENIGYPCSICTAHQEGGNGAIDLAKKIIEISNREIDYHPLYNETNTIKEKIEKISKEIYRSNKIEYTEKALQSLEKIQTIKKEHYPICIAKTQYSLSDDPKKLGLPTNHTITVRDMKLCNGAEFIVVYMGNIMTMPGLSKNPSYLNMKIDKNGNITGLS